MYSSGVGYFSLLTKIVAKLQNNFAEYVSMPRFIPCALSRLFIAFYTNETKLEFFRFDEKSKYKGSRGTYTDLHKIVFAS